MRTQSIEKMRNDQMAPTTLSCDTVSMDPLKCGTANSTIPPTHLGPNLQKETRSCQGSIAIRMELSGLMSTEIIAHDSATEERLCEVLRTAHPLIERLQEILIAFGSEDIGVTH